MTAYPEPKVVAQVTARVRDRLPDVVGTEVDQQVADLFQEYADSKVRDFLPILVEREAVARLQRVRGPTVVT